jgi:hypothetical protein
MKNFVIAAILLLSAATGFAAAARGLGVSLPLVGRLAGGGGVVYKTAVDVTNNGAAPTQVDFYVDGVDLRTNATIGIYGSLTTTGFAAQGSGTIGSRVNVHFDDFVEALSQAGLITPDTLANGFLGSAMFVFNNATRSGQGSASARFYNPANGGGTVGVALKGHEISTNETQTLVATVSDTRAVTSGVPQLYTNMFINNSGLTVAGATTNQTVVVELRAYAASNGAAVGTPSTVTLAPGKTASVSNVMAVLGVPASEQGAVVVAKVLSGNASIQGLVSVVDNTTKDGSAFEMGRGD